jgi:flagellar hook-length control protein FliK
MNTLNSLNAGLRATQSGPDALLQLDPSKLAGSNGASGADFAGLLKNFDSLGGMNKPTEPTPTPADPAPNKQADAKPAETQRLQSQAPTAQTAARPDQADTTQDTSADATKTAQTASADKSKPADAKQDAKDNSTAKADASDDKTTAGTETDATKLKRSRKLAGDTATDKTAEGAAQDKPLDPGITPDTAKPVGAKYTGEVCELPANANDKSTTTSANAGKGSAVEQALGRATERAQDQQVTARDAILQAASGESQNTQAAAAQTFATELKTLTAQGGPTHVGSIDGLAQPTATAGTSATTTAAKDDAAATPVPVTITQPLDDAGFASELGARLTVLAQDGVQHAELHLNPADMGPVAVNIKLDGQQAQVTFHAAQADTRNVLEQGLPDLAAALAGAGLTLAGGGVFQQQSQGGRERQGSDGQTAGSGQRGTDAGTVSAATASQPVRVAQQRGVVDLYA